MPVLAAIDVGSHAMRLAVVRLSPAGSVNDLGFYRWPIRLGADVFAEGRIGSERSQALLDIFAIVADHMRRLGVEAYRAVATSAMRDARNGKHIVEKIRRKTGVEVEIISGLEEGRLSRDALVQALGSVPPDTLLVDLGGGSLELRRAHGRWGKSVPLGTVRLLERFPEMRGALTAVETSKIVRAIEADLGRCLRRVSCPLAIGTGGNLNVLARLVPAKPGYHPAIDVRRLGSVALRIAAAPPHERVTLFGLRLDRADVLTPAVLVIHAVVRYFGVQSFVVPGTGLRETILRSLADASETELRARQVMRRLGRRSSAPAKIATRLFELLAPVHGLWRPARATLAVAARLAATIRPDELRFGVKGFGLCEYSCRVAAYVATQTRGDGLNSGSELCDDDSRTARVLIGLLRVADAIAERGVRIVDVDLTKSPIVIRAGLKRALPATVCEPLSRILSTEILIR
ncbi:MAG: hypothetical protein A2289_15085 [Deltaproteobacteria bacterium RIFOXYA12_FULL_58_15]|nr:MAG: hypothetical protein A2289_15085 [Deltaproteobacteria bacterium RIFOXYA12_FULL_58_15]OGR13036.1 MAG: hypothetical protein A2341_08225 [Deltaproteobacteria bacterium RIFOXYB12_FULL_58_9]